MMFSFRRKPLALLICCAFAGSLAGTLAGQAQAAEPLRVDPVLLGLPPIKPVEAPPPVEPVRSVIHPVEAPVVESRPVPVEPQASRPAANRQASPAEIPARAVAPQAAPAVVVPSPLPAPAEAALPLLVVPARDPREDERKAAPVQRSQAVVPPASPAPAAALRTGALAPLRVDPALLGLPPVVASRPAPYAETPVLAARTAAAARLA
ncbi:MAG: hypothetical protein WAZ34_00485, partial [Rhodocyclaceae bacterium]